MRRSSSRDASSEFERISLDELPPQSSRPQLHIVPPTETNPSGPSPSSLSPSRPIIIPRVSLQRNISSGPTSHWRKPSYSRVDSSANPQAISPSSSRQYDDEGAVELEVSEVQEGLNAALGTGAELGSWLPTTRHPSFRRNRSPSVATPQIVIEDTAVQDVFEPDERETAGLAVNASQIAGTEPVRRTRTLSRGRSPPGELLGFDLGQVERRGSQEGGPNLPVSPGGSEGDRNLATTSSVIRHIRKASQRVVNLANAGDEKDEDDGFPFHDSTTRSRPVTREGLVEFPFPSLGPSTSHVDKFATEFNVSETGHSPHIDAVALRGKSLGIFGPDNYIRNWLCNVLLHSATEPVLLLVIITQTVFLTIQSAPNVEEYPQTMVWGHSWVDYCLLVVFVFYTLESFARIVVSGFIFNPPTEIEVYRKEIGPRPTAIVLQGSGSQRRSRSKSPGASLRRKDTLKRQYSTSAVRRPSRQYSYVASSTQPQPQHLEPSASGTAGIRHRHSIHRTSSPGPFLERGRHHDHQEAQEPMEGTQEYITAHRANFPTPFLSAATFHKADINEVERARNLHKARLARRAYLRHSFNRMDFIAVVSYWIALILELTRVMNAHHVYVFQMLSCLRIFRLLGITEGTSTILRSLKKAAPLLVQVAFFVLFFWVIFAIIGIQTFRGSFRRQCVYIDPLNSTNTFVQKFQFCGGHLSPIDFSPQPYITANGQPSNEEAKGYLCPVQSQCIEGANPYNGTVSFDNIAQAMELVFVIITANTFTDLMYYSIDAEYMVASLFFIIGIVVLTFWLVNLVIAVITSSFQITREENRQSAFTSDAQQRLLESEAMHLSQSRPLNWAQQWYNRTKIVWIALIAADLTIQCLRTAAMSPKSADLLRITETVATIIFDIEIIIRFAISFPDWRSFFRKKTNIIDLFLAIATSVIQIPVIRDSGAYGWLTIFQIMRVYRVIMAIPVTRDLLSKVLSNVFGLLNLILFLFMITFFCAILACQLVRGDIPTVDPVTGQSFEISFRTVWNAFLGMYQILSSENWTTILYATTSYQTQYHIAWISAAFFILWFIVGNNVVLSLFIAVIQENIGVTEDEKRKQQVRAFIAKAVPTLAKTEIHSNLTMASVFRKKKKEPLFDSGPEAFNLLMKEAVVREFLDEQEAERAQPVTLQEQRQQQREEQASVMGRLKTWVKGTTVHRRFGETFNLYSTASFATSVPSLSSNPNTMAQDAVNAHRQQRAHQANFLKSNPKINKSLWIFPADNPIRRLCQLVVAPSRGERLEGVEPNPIAWWCFSAITYAAIVCIVVLACITTPLYQIVYFAEHGENRFNWITWSDIAFAIIFSFEAIIKIIADGFLFTPNAYIRNIWNDIDFFVLITLWINVVADLTDRGGLSRAFRAFKALRALRLVNISDTARQTFHDVIISGFWNILSAAVVALSLLIPYAIWGLNIFNGLFFSCNDGSNGINKSNCVGEYASSPQNWTVWAPRSWKNPEGYNFDSFGASLSILFEIVSQEGWINVMTTAMAVVGPDQNPTIDASPLNAIFFVGFNLLGAVFVLTLFISVIITNYTKRSGVAYMTADQRSWQELRKVLLQLRPSRRPAERPDQNWRAWCYDRAISKHGYWTRFMTGVYIFHVIVLTLEIYPSPTAYSRTQDYLFLFLSFIYILNIGIRMVGLGTYHYFRSLWDIYDLVVVTGTFATTVALLAQVNNNVFLQFQKLFLVSIAFNLIPRSDALDQLFKTAASSLPTILSLLSIWLVLFVVYAIAFTQIFGLTRLGPNGSGTINFRTVPNALVLLFRMSVGEGWNSIMHDYTISDPHCVSDPNFFRDDCGSPAWAYGLFTSWNILSMYIFSSMLLTVVYENFSYVYQRAGKLRLFSREETRAFKKLWAKFDKHATGYLQKGDVPKFLSQLRGLFEVRIYDEFHSVRTILQQCKLDADETKVHTGGATDISNIDLHLLRICIDRLPVEEIQERRRNFNILYEEAMLSAEERGVSFTAMLLMLAHYKFIDDNKALSLDEFLRRRAKLVRVTDQVNEKICRGFFQTLYWRRRFLAQRSSANPFSGVVPSIVVQESEAMSLSVPRPALPSLDLTQMREIGHSYASSLSGLSPTSSDGPRLGSSDGASSPIRTWGNLGAPDSQIATSSGGSELFVPLNLSVNFRSQPLDEAEASQVVQSLNQSAWSSAIRSTTSRSGASSGIGKGSAGTDARD